MMIHWADLFKNELMGWVYLIFGSFMFFCIIMLGEIGKIGDWLFKKRD